MRGKIGVRYGLNGTDALALAWRENEAEKVALAALSAHGYRDVAGQLERHLNEIGYAVVPIDPTGDMLEAAHKKRDILGEGLTMGEIWRAMLEEC